MIPSTIFLISCYYCTSPVVITLQLLTLLETLLFAATAVAVASDSTVAVAVDAAVAITDVNTTAVTYAADVSVTAVTVSICAPVADAFSMLLLLLLLFSWHITLYQLGEAYFFIAGNNCMC